MGVDLKKVKSGDRLRIPAQTFNAFVDAARAHGNSAHDVRRRGAVGRRTGDILIQNKTGGDLDEFSVVGLGDPIFEPTDDETTATFKAQVGFEGETPATADHTGKFAIILEPLAADAIGPARVSGVCPVEIDITDTGHTCADIDNAETGNLNSGVTGAAQIIWAETGTGVKWAVVRLGSATGIVVLFGKISAMPTLTAPLITSIHPCNEDGSGEDTGTTISIYPRWKYGIANADAAPLPQYAVGEVIAYVPFGTTTGVLVGDWILPKGVAAADKNTLLFYGADGKMAKVAPPNADYKVLQRKADDSIGWDYLRFSD